MGRTYEHNVTQERQREGGFTGFKQRFQHRCIGNIHWQFTHPTSSCQRRFIKSSGNVIKSLAVENNLLARFHAICGIGFKNSENIWNIAGDLRWAVVSALENVRDDRNSFKYIPTSLTSPIFQTNNANTELVTD